MIIQKKSKQFLSNYTKFRYKFLYKFKRNEKLIENKKTKKIIKDFYLPKRSTFRHAVRRESYQIGKKPKEIKILFYKSKLIMKTKIFLTKSIKTKVISPFF